PTNLVGVRAFSSWRAGVLGARRPAAPQRGQKRGVRGAQPPDVSALGSENQNVRGPRPPNPPLGSGKSCRFFGRSRRPLPGTAALYPSQIYPKPDPHGPAHRGDPGRPAVAPRG